MPFDAGCMARISYKQDFAAKSRRRSCACRPPRGFRGKTSTLLRPLPRFGACISAAPCRNGLYGRMRAASRCGAVVSGLRGRRQGKRLAGLGLFRTLPAADDRRYGFASRCGPLWPEKTPWPPIARRRFSGVWAAAAFFCPLFPIVRIIKLSFNGFCVCRYGLF